MGKFNKRARWDSLVEKIWKGIGGNQEDILSVEKFGGYKTEGKERIAGRERLALRSKVKDEEHLKERRGRNEIRICTARWTTRKTLKLRFRVGDLDLPERRTRHTVPVVG